MKHLFSLAAIRTAGTATRKFASGALFVLVFFMPWQPAFAENASTSLEYKVKAVVLFNFAKYVRWPEKTFESPSQPIRICIVGNDPFGEVFQSTEAPKEAQDRPLKVVELQATSKKEELAKCQLLFWTKDYDASMQPLLPVLHQHSVLTVSDVPTAQALISFTLEDDRVRFRVRYKEAQELGLSISSQLLKLAILDD